MIKISAIIILLLSIFLTSCQKNKVNELESTIEDNPEELYRIAKQDLDNDDYENATKNFKKLNSKFPLSNEGIQAKVMLTFIDYIKMDYENAINNANLIINKYPSYKNIDYVYYIKAISYYEQIRSEKLDGSSNNLALKNFEKIINLFPNSKYVIDSRQKIIAIKENIAAKHMNIALFYQNNKKYMSAIKRYNIVINEYSTSKFAPEALHRLVEIYLTLGMVDDANKTAAVLSYNYPKSLWYKKTYELVGEKEDEKISLFSKISQYLKSDNEKKE